MSGCGELARELIQAGLVDELYFWIHPRIQGPGGRPVRGATVPVRLIEVRQFDSGVTLLRYEPCRTDEIHRPTESDDEKSRQEENEDDRDRGHDPHRTRCAPLTYDVQSASAESEGVMSCRDAYAGTRTPSP